MNIVIIIVSIVAIILLKIGLNVHFKDMQKIKEIGYDKELNKIGNKFPTNIEICKKILEKLNNKDVKIEEDKDSKTSLYIAISNKIIIANIQDTFTRIQTIAHECLHSVQNRKILLFNFIFSNVFLLYFIVAIFLIIFNAENSMTYIQTYFILGIIYCTVRMYLETEAMSKAIYVAKDYMKDYQQDSKNVTDEEIEILVNKFAELNKIGIPFTNFQLVTVTLIKGLVLLIISIVA